MQQDLCCHDNMENVYFTSDTHFGHKGLVEKRLRMRDGIGGKIPFRSIEEHDKLIIDNWNSVVGINDRVYHLGDFGWLDVANYRRRLNGKIHLILGNHDRLKAEDRKVFESISDIKSVRIEGQLIYMMHYAMVVWNKSHYGSWMLYGHSHGSLPDNPNSLSFDVGVDCWDFKPLSFDDVRRRMNKKTWKPVDHHGSTTE